MLGRRFLLILAPLLAGAFGATSGALACVVGTGTSASCTEAALNNCLPASPSFDGTVTFACGGGAIITVTGTKGISAETTIDGGTINGGPATTISGGGTVNVLFAMNAPFTIRNLGIRSATGSGAILRIGDSPAPLSVTNCNLFDNFIAITTDGPLTVNDSTFGGNTVAIAGGNPVTVNRSSLLNNDGAGITSSGPVTVTDSTFGGNDAPSSGGAIKADGSLTVRNCLFHENTAGGNGGAILSGGETSVSNTTFFGNRAGGGFQGGAIAHLSSSTLTVTNCTFSANGAGTGGAIRASPGAATVVNTILASALSGGNCSGTITDGGHNIDDATTCGFTGAGCTNTAGTSFCNTNPLLGALANNGGPTNTFALPANSPAVEAGDQVACGAPPVNGLDQRGLVRPGLGASSCSIGAYEFEAVACGDVNADGDVDIGDALVVAQYDVAIRTCGQGPFSRPPACDINADGDCNIGDALKMAQCDVGLISCTFTCGSFACP